MKVTMKRSLLITLCSIIASAGLLTGCAWSIGGKGAESSVQPTKGQELIDLKRAKDTGAISDEEYEAQKQRAMQK